MKSYGDMPEHHKRLVEELTLLEEWFYEHGSTLPILVVAKGMVCIAHDYYTMDMEEEGDRLLFLTDKHCPGYFRAPIIVHTQDDLEFFYLVEYLKLSMALEIMEYLGFQI